MSRRREWLIERVALGEVPPHAREEAAALAGEAAGLEPENQAILAALPAEAVGREVARRAAAAPPARRRVSRAVVLSTAAACAVAVLLLARATGDDGESARPTGEETRAKGAARLLLHRKRGDQVDPLERTGAPAGAGDRIQISYLSGGARHGVILSVDGAGVVTLHYPEPESASTQLAPDGPISLPHSYELDDAPAFERFFFVTASGPIDVKAVTGAARRLAREPARAGRDPLPLPPDLSQTSFLLHKHRTP